MDVTGCLGVTDCVDVTHCMDVTHCVDVTDCLDVTQCMDVTHCMDVTDCMDVMQCVDVIHFRVVMCVRACTADSHRSVVGKEGRDTSCHFRLPGKPLHIQDVPSQFAACLASSIFSRSKRVQSQSTLRYYKAGACLYRRFKLSAVNVLIAVSELW